LAHFAVIDSILASLLATTVAGPPPEATALAVPPVQQPSAPQKEPREDEADVGLKSAVVRIEGILHQDFQSALSLRAKGVAILRHEDRPEPSKPYVFVGVRPTPGVGGSFDLELIVSDGRAYDRTVQVEDDQAARTIASNVSQLMAGIEDGTVAPDRSDVPIPEPEPPRAECEPCPEPPPPEPEPEPRPSSHELGLTPALGSILGLGPPTDVDRFAAWGGGLGLGFRFRSGALIVADVRVSGRGHHTGYSIVRTRVGLGGGYVVRVADFEMPAVLSATIEPWIVMSDGHAHGTTTPPGESESRQLLAGGAVRLSPGYRIEPSPNVSLRVGFRVELAASWIADHDTGVARLLIGGDDPQPALRVGGAELLTGIDTTVWFRLPTRKQR
jgi:hypothetical protein